MGYKEMDYKEGDRVVCDEDGGTDVVHEALGTVKRRSAFMHMGNPMYVIILDGDKYHRTVSAVYLAPLPPPKYKIGDRVRNPASYVGTVVVVSPDQSTPHMHVKPIVGHRYLVFWDHTEATGYEDETNLSLLQ